MQCISPIYINAQFVPCGKCNCCLQSRRMDWAFRLKQEMRVSKSAHFITLTYDDEHIPYNPETGFTELRKTDVQLFIKRLRKYNTKIVAHLKWPTLRYYLVGEYGTRTRRPHYHIILFNSAEQTIGWLVDIWGKGQIKVGTVTPASIMYTAKYHLNKFEEFEGRVKPFCLISNRSGGLGANYINRTVWWHTENQATYCIDDGKKIPMPRFYRDKIFDKGEKRYLTQKSQLRAQENTQKLIAELAEFHHDPHQYLIELEQSKHDSIKHKSNLNDTF